MKRWHWYAIGFVALAALIWSMSKPAPTVDEVLKQAEDRRLAALT